MKTSKRLIAALLAAVLAVACFAGCHQKDATVATYTANGKTYSMSSGEYAMALILAESEGRSKVSESLTDAEKNSNTEVDYYKKTIDKKNFSDWVVDRAEELIRQYFYVAEQFDKNKLTLSDSDKQSMDSYLNYTWSLSGYQYICEPNGVSYDSFAAYETVASYQRNTLFRYLYGTDGPKAVAADEVTKTLTDNYVVADVIEIKPSDMKEKTDGESSDKKQTDEEKKAEEKALKEKAKQKLEGYVERLNKGVTFSAIYYEHTGKKPEEKEEDKENESDPKPKDELAAVYGAEDTSVANDLFKTVKDCKVGVPTVTEAESGNMLLVIRQEITGDPYYADTYNDECLYLIKNEEFMNDLESAAKKLDVKINNYERNYIKPKKIDYTQYQAYMTSMYSQYAG